MSTNEIISLINTMLGSSLIALGVLFFWQARTRHSLWVWPPSALVALGSVPFLTGLIILQLALFRTVTLPYPFGVSDPGTLLLRLFATVVVMAKTIRVYQGKLLTEHDRTRIIESRVT